MGTWALPIAPVTLYLPGELIAPVVVLLLPAVEEKLVLLALPLVVPAGMKECASCEHEKQS